MQERKNSENVLAQLNIARGEVNDVQQRLTGMTAIMASAKIWRDRGVQVS